MAICFQDFIDSAHSAYHPFYSIFTLDQVTTLLIEPIIDQHLDPGEEGTVLGERAYEELMLSRSTFGRLRIRLLISLLGF